MFPACLPRQLVAYHWYNWTSGRQEHESSCLNTSSQWRNYNQLDSELVGSTVVSNLFASDDGTLFPVVDEWWIKQSWTGEIKTATIRWPNVVLGHSMSDKYDLLGRDIHRAKNLDG